MGHLRGPPGTYWITAVIDPIDGELDTDDNVCTSLASVTVSAPVGGEIAAFSPLAMTLALMTLIKLMIPLTTLLMIIAATVLAAYVIRKKKRQN